MRKPFRLAVPVVLCLSLALSACGSRRPPTAFGHAGESAASPSSSAATAVGAGTSTGEAPAVGTKTAAPTLGDTSTGETQTTNGANGAEASSTGGPTRGTTDGASDVGVTASTINLGNITSKSGAFGPDQFTAFYYGASAYFADLNARGGITGRKVAFSSCDDMGDPGGDSTCARRLIDDQKVFALVANECLACDGLTYVSSKAVPSVGGQAIDSRDYALPHFWRYSGNPYPRGGSIGYRGKFYQGTQQYRYFRQKYGVKKAAVVYYDDGASSSSAGQATLNGLKAEGIEATGYPMNGVLPVYDRAVADMKSRGITAIWDGVSPSDTRALCSSIDSSGLVLKGLVSSSPAWTHAMIEQLHSPCRGYLFDVEDPGALRYDQMSNPQVAAFRAAMRRHFPDREDKLNQSVLDGWASAMWFTDAAASCGRALTRACLERYLNAPQGYAAHGLWWPRNNNVFDFARRTTVYRCIQVTQWADAKKTFVVRGAFSSTCATTPYLPYTAPR